MVTPGRNASGVDPKTRIVLKFSEPMDKKTVEETFSVRSFNSRKLSVDNGKTSFNTFSGDSQISTVSNNLIWDKNAYNISWNSDDTEVTFAFKEERLLPTDKDTDKIPDYQVAFNDTIGSSGRLLKDKSGISRANNHFKLTDGPFEETYKFAIKADEVKPDVASIVAQTNENQGVNGDAVKVLYSERMIIYTKTRTIAGGGEDIDSGSAQKAPAGYPGGTSSTNRAASANYTVSITPVGTTSTTYVGTWQNLGGSAVYDTNDPTHKTVILMPPRFTGISSGQVVANSTTTYAETNNTAAAISAGVTSGFTQVITLSYLAADGTVTTTTSAAQQMGLSGATGATIAATLQTVLNSMGTAIAAANSGWSVTHTSSAAGTENFQYRFSNTAAAAPVAAAISFGAATGVGGSVPVLPSGWKASSNTRMNTAVGSNGFVNVYAAGDTVRVVVNSTVLDPAGNTLNTSRDNGSGNAS
jgi:hypothetical protein